jgi:hypothetical protein
MLSEWWAHRRRSSDNRRAMKRKGKQAPVARIECGAGYATTIFSCHSLFVFVDAFRGLFAPFFAKLSGYTFPSRLEMLHPNRLPMATIFEV